MEIHDYIIVGSGCTGAIAAKTLVDAGVHVTMLDADIGENKYASIIPDKDYITVRKTEQEQSRYFVGDQGEGIAWGKVKTGEHLTPPRKHILTLVDKYLPVDSSTFFQMESLSYGGLGNAWGLGCCEYSEIEIKAIGLDYKQTNDAYNAIGKQIGISGAKDDASPYTLGRLDAYQQATKMDSNHTALFKRYIKNKNQLNSNGFYMGRPALALITEDLNDRKKYAYRDMDFYSDNDKSAYRPWITIDELKKKNNFNYIGGYLVVSFSEMQDHMEVNCIEVNTNSRKIFKCKKLILASGVLGTARIVLRSFDSAQVQLPLLCNPYSYIPCIQPSMVGKEVEKNKMGFSQLSLFHDPEKTNFGVTMGSIYSYQSLMLFRIIKEAPLNFSDARILMRYLMSGIVIMGIHHPDQKSNSKFIELIKDDKSPTNDKLKATYILSESEKNKIQQVEKKYTRALRSIGAYAIKRIDPGAGSSIHYAGTLPFSNSNDPFTILSNGKLAGTKNVFIADGSGFNYLPAKGLTLTLMANAFMVAKNVLKNE